YAEQSVSERHHPASWPQPLVPGYGGRQCVERASAQSAAAEHSAVELRSGERTDRRIAVGRNLCRCQGDVFADRIAEYRPVAESVRLTWYGVACAEPRRKSLCRAAARDQRAERAHDCDGPAAASLSAVHLG